MKKNSNYYFKDKKKYVRVNTILHLIYNYYLEKWKMGTNIKYVIENKVEHIDHYINYHEIVAAEQADIGSQVHRIINCIFQKKKYRISNDIVKQCVTAFNSFISDNQFEIIESEVTLFGENNHFAGTVDLICRYNNTVYCIDIKTSTKIYDTHKLQLGGYKKLLEENGYKIDEYAILRLVKKPVKKIYHFKVVEDIDRYEKMFLLLLEYFNLSQKNIKV